MNKIEIYILNENEIKVARDTTMFAARITQHGHEIKSIDDLKKLYNKPYKESTFDTINKLPHPNIQELNKINIVIYGSSRRVLSQLTRAHESKFVSASLQYSTYGNDADFVVPYDILGNDDLIKKYLESCKNSMNNYIELNKLNVDNDSCGYTSPAGLRNILLISATPAQFKHLISQRSCKRNTKETQYVILKIWEALYNIDNVMFNSEVTGPFCMQSNCKEGKMSCGKPIKKGLTPSEIIKIEFPKLYKENINES